MSLRPLTIALASSLLACAPAALAQPAAEAPQLVARLLPEVVSLTIQTFETTPSVPGNITTQPAVTEKKSEGTGFIVDPIGIIVTNRHVVAGASEIMATLEDGTRLRATLLAAAAHSDIALLKVDADRPLPAARFGDSDAVQPGDRVLVIGNPLGLEETVTRGIVSALDRTSAASESDAFVQIDAAFNRGNSGAPVFNADGQVIAVGTALFSPEDGAGSVGLGLAIPANDVVSVINQLWATGHDSVGWIGAHVQGLTADVAAALGRPTTAGSIVTEVAGDGPAAKAGLGAGDVILRVDDADAGTPRSLNRKIAGSPIGSTIRLTLWRNGALQTVPVTVRQLPSDAAATKAAGTDGPHAIRPPARVVRDDLGLVLGPVTGEVARRLGLTAAPQVGVAINDVVAHSVAADHGVTAGSILLNVDQQPASSPAAVLQLIDAARGAHRAFILLLVQDRSGLRWAPLPLIVATPRSG